MVGAMRGFFEFYYRCILRAFSGRFWLAEKWTGGVGLLALLATQLIPMPPAAAEMIEVTLPIYFFGVAFATVVMVGLLSAPYNIYIEEREKRENLELLRKPKISVSVPNGGRSVIETGFTSETISGHRTTVVNQSFNGFLFIQCGNTGEVRLRDCVARLIIVHPKTQVGLSSSIEPVVIPWNAHLPEKHLSRDLESGEGARAWVARVTNSGHAWLVREPQRIPVDYRQVFGETGKYVCVIQVTAENAAPVEVLLRLDTEVVDRNASGIVVGRGRITLIGQASPHLARADIEAETRQ